MGKTNGQDRYPVEGDCVEFDLLALIHGVSRFSDLPIEAEFLEHVCRCEVTMTTHLDSGVPIHDMAFTPPHAEPQSSSAHQLQ